MKIIDHKLYLTLQEAVVCGIGTEASLKVAKAQGRKTFEFKDDPQDKRKVLISYEDLKDQHKQLVKARYGKNPYEFAGKDGLLNLVAQDTEAWEYFSGYRYDGDKMLPIGTVHQYTRAASWLNMLLQYTAGEGKGKLKKLLNLSMSQLWTEVEYLLNLEKANARNSKYIGYEVLPGDFPTSYRRLKPKVDEYAEVGYGLLIHPNYGNKHASKLGKMAVIEGDMYQKSSVKLLENGTNEGVNGVKNDKNGGAMYQFSPDLYEQQMAVIRTVAASYRNLDAKQVEKIVTPLFLQKGWKPLSRERLREIIKENMHTLAPGRAGSKNWANNHSIHVMRKAPDAPLKYWTLDAWDVELGYKEGSSYNRLVVCMVLDPYKKYIAGYAIGEQENAALIKAACRNALAHIKQITGKAYKPAQVQSDNYAIKQMLPFYQAMSTLAIPAAVGNAKAKVIEPYFKYINKEYCQLMSNWTGFGVKAKNQINTEMMNKIKSSWPDKAGLVAQIEEIIAKERAAKAEQYIPALQAYAENLSVIEYKDYLVLFGTVSEKAVGVSGVGIIKQIKGKKYVYDTYDMGFRARNTKWIIVYDELYLDSVLAVSECGKYKYILERKRALPMDRASMTEDDFVELSLINAANKAEKERITQVYAQDAETVQAILNESEASGIAELQIKTFLTIGGQNKALKQKAIGRGSEPLEAGVITQPFQRPTDDISHFIQD